MENNWLTIKEEYRNYRKEVVLKGCSGEATGELMIPDSVKRIGYYAFSGCTGLTSINIPDSVTEIGAWAFKGCTGLTSINIPDSVTVIDGWTFEGCTGLTSINIPDGVTVIGNGAFEGCTGLTSINIPDSVTVIHSRAFADCTGLTSINIPDGVTEIYYSAFDNTPFYNNMEDGVVYINKVLYKYKGIMTPNTKITVANGTISISRSAFEGCTGLTSINIPDSVTEIGSCAFEGCTGLTSINIPDSVTEIGSWAFKGCTGLTSINIPDGVTVIGNGAFEGCTGLTSINIPDSVTEIGSEAFADCTGLTSINIPDSVKKFAADAFDGTPLHRKAEDCIYIGKLLYKHIGSQSKITIADGTNSIMSHAFEDTLRKINNIIVVFEGNIPETNGAFNHCTIEELRVNVPRQKTVIPDDILNALRLDDYKNRGKIIYAAPDLCEEQSQIPGYIKATMTEIYDKLGPIDKLVDINTKYIVSVEPQELERYHPHTGSLITFAAPELGERLYRLQVYESCDMVLKKIEDSLNMLSQQVGGVAGLLNQLETLCNKKD